MPFQAAWRNYNHGDLLYGLAANRELLADQFNIPNGVVYTIDQYDTFNAHRPVTGLNHNGSFIASLLAHPRYSSVVGYDLSDKTLQGGLNWAVNTVRALAMARRKCKGGLQWATQNNLNGRHIHFCLDGIDLVAAATKNLANYQGVGEHPVGKALPGTQWDTKVRSVTGEELRWVYKFRNNIGVMSKIQFWKRTWTTPAHGIHRRVFVQCPPPWADPSQPYPVRQAWANYVPTGFNAGGFNVATAT